MLPPAEQRLVEFLLLLPVAALIICVFRNVIGLGSFGTFAPALIGLAFRDLQQLAGHLRVRVDPAGRLADAPACSIATTCCRCRASPLHAEPDRDAC